MQHLRIALIVVGLLSACASAVRPRFNPATGMSDFEHHVDRPGADYRNVSLEEPDPSICNEACMVESTCMAWTYVGPREGIAAQCFLKHSVTRPQHKMNAISGVKDPFVGPVRQHDAIAAQEPASAPPPSVQAQPAQPKPAQPTESPNAPPLGIGTEP